MKSLISRALLALSLFALAAPALAGGPPPIPPAIALQGTHPVSLAVTTGTANVTLGDDAATFPVIVVSNVGTAEAFVQIGAAACTANTTNNYRLAIQPNTARAFWGASAVCLAALTASGSTTLRIDQTNGFPAIAALTPGPASGGTAAINLTQLNSGTIATGTGASNAQTQRVTVSSDSTIGAEGGDGSTQASNANGLPVSETPYPYLATAITAASGNVANASAAASLAGVSGKTTYITGFQCTSSGATVGAVVNLTVTGVITGTMTYTYVAVAGAVLADPDKIVIFSKPVPASAPNTAITVTLPALGAGNTNSACNAQGFQL